MNHLTLLTDLYELTMMQGYFKTGNNETVVFDAFYRTNPGNGGYAVCAGLEQIIEYIKDLHFSDTDISYLRSVGIFEEDFLEYLKEFRFSGDIYAIPEGTVIAPIMEAQLIETAVLNILNHQSLIATKAARVCYAADKDSVMEFGLRRAQGPDAGVYGARAAMIGGCCGTSNVLCGQKFDVPVKGTHAHSWIMSFSDEYTAFRKYAELYPSACILLVDTYDTLKSGVPNAIRVFTEMREAGIPLTFYGIRMDSGDLAYLSKIARNMLDAAGFQDAVISASNDLDEYLIENLKAQGAKITSWGVGTNLITSRDCPAFGGVYKLAAIQDQNGKFLPKIKLSKNPDKKLRLFDSLETWKRTTLPGGTYTMRELLVKIFEKGTCVYESPKVMEIQKYCEKEKNTLWNETKRFANPHEVYVDLSDNLFDMKRKILNEYSLESGGAQEVSL